MIPLAIVGCESTNVIYSLHLSLPFLKFSLPSALISAGLNDLFNDMTKIFTPE